MTPITLSLSNQTQIDESTQARPGETKLGQTVACPKTPHWQHELTTSNASFVLLGIPEDLGVRANFGVGGAETSWPAALRALLNMQSNRKLNGSEIFVLGHINCGAYMCKPENIKPEQLRTRVSELDRVVADIVALIVASGKIPLVVGGGHNNALPLIQGASRALGRPIAAVNLDPHSDYRSLEGRHSGNAFRYAKADNCLGRYYILGLHEQYNSERVLQDLDNDDNIHYSFYEDLFFPNAEGRFEAAIKEAIAFTHGYPTGIELDIDSIIGALSSARTPCGVSAAQARSYLRMMAENSQIAYLHLPEAAVRLDNGMEDQTTGKLLAYLLTDFIKCWLKTHHEFTAAQ